MKYLNDYNTTVVVYPLACKSPVEAQALVMAGTTTHTQLQQIALPSGTSHVAEGVLGRADTPLQLQEEIMYL